MKIASYNSYYVSNINSRSNFNTKFNLQNKTYNDIYIKSHSELSSFTGLRMPFKKAIKDSIKAIRDAEIRIFQPYKRPNILEDLPEKYSTIRQKAKEVIIKTEDGIDLKCWDIPAERGKPYVIYYHGLRKNLAGNAQAMEFLAKEGYGVFGLEYRGYAGNLGNPMQAEHLKDSRAALNYLLKEKQIQKKDIGILGVSMGGAIAVDFAAKTSGLKFLMVLSSFTTTGEMHKEFLKRFPNSYKVSDKLKKLISKMPAKMVPVANKYNSTKNIKKVDYPTLIIHSEPDNTIPAQMSKKIGKSAMKKNNDVNLHILKDGDHDTLEEKIPYILDFLKKYN